VEATPSIDDIAARLELDLESRVAPFAEHIYTGADPEDWPVLCLDDLSAIPFLVNISGVEEYQHRARVRAGDGDLFAVVTPPVEGYEAYCRDSLGLGSSELVAAMPVDGGSPLGVARACSNGEPFERIVARARDAGGLFLHPYMSIEPVWELAARVARDATVPVRVIGPPPPVCWLANDKKLFGELVSSLLGDDWLVRTAYSRDPRELAEALVSFRRDHVRVGLKRTRCASAMGNAVFDSASLEGSVDSVEERVRAFLRETEWDGREEVLAVAWEDTELSPSTQTWIPPRGHGAVCIDGVYEQILEGEARVFIGSRPASLPHELMRRLHAASLVVATALQRLGYVGRCSFDFVVVGDVDDEPSVHFTECNGRWGGTSIPMSLLDRLLGTRTRTGKGKATAPSGRPPYRAQDFVHRALVGASFEDIVNAVGDELFTASSGGRFIFYNPGPLPRSGKIDVIAVGTTQEEAEEALALDLPRLLRL
jgi:hypothetical protein